MAYRSPSLPGYRTKDQKIACITLVPATRMSLRDQTPTSHSPLLTGDALQLLRYFHQFRMEFSYRQDNERRENEPGGGALSSRFGRTAIVLNSLSSPSGPLAARLASNSSTSPPRARRRTASRCAASASSRRTRWWRGRTTRRVRGPHPPPSSPPRSKTVSRARSRMTSDLKIYPGLIQT